MEKKGLVIAGISGGVDSAVAAALLLEQGFNVAGVFMKNWEEKDEAGVCTDAADYEDARAVCAALSIPLYTVNFAEEYYERVFSHFLSEYAAGRTPNPDVLCNSQIKFDAFLHYAKSIGADYIATGHYAQTGQREGRAVLKKGADPGKDQSYFLCMLTDEQLSPALFPVGGMQKARVRELAESYALPVARKKDSTGICFIGERRFREFLMGFLPATPGDIVDMAGHTVGRHLGVMYYTLGQRKGLDIGGRAGGDGRWYVVSKDVKNNLLTVSQGDETPLFSRGCTVTGINLINPLPSSLDCCVKLRYRQADQRARVAFSGNSARVICESPQRAVTPGQYAVFYAGDECLGGGVIDEVIK